MLFQSNHGKISGEESTLRHYLTFWGNRWLAPMPMDLKYKAGQWKSSQRFCPSSREERSWCLPPLSGAFPSQLLGEMTRLDTHFSDVWAESGGTTEDSVGL